MSSVRLASFGFNPLLLSARWPKTILDCLSRAPSLLPPERLPSMPYILLPYSIPPLWPPIHTPALWSPSPSFRRYAGRSPIQESIRLQGHISSISTPFFAKTPTVSPSFFRNAPPPTAEAYSPSARVWSPLHLAREFLLLACDTLLRT